MDAGVGELAVRKAPQSARSYLGAWLAVRRGAVLAHLLSLDAVAVALVWQEAIGRAARCMPTLAERAALGLAVWCIYLLDRQIDAARLRPGKPATLRHRMHKRFFGVFAALLLLGLVGTASAALRLDSRVIEAGLAVAGATGLYLLVVQKWPRFVAGGVKEVCVGTVFAMGCALHAAARGSAGPGLVVTMTMAAVLFATNCLMIGSWEAKLDRAQGWTDGSSPLGGRTWKLAIGLLIAAALWSALSVAGGLSGRAAVGAALALAAGLLLYLDHLAEKGYSTRLRAAADFVLLTPLIMWTLFT